MIYPDGVVTKLFGSDCTSHRCILAFNKMRYKDGKGDPKGFVSALQSNEMPKGLLPRYHRNRLHIMFEIGGRLHEHDGFFTKLLEETTVTCGGLQAALLHDYLLSVAKVEFQVLGLFGKLLIGPWMTKFYNTWDSDVSHVDGIAIMKDARYVLKDFSSKPEETLTTATDFFRRNLDQAAVDIGITAKTAS